MGFRPIACIQPIQAHTNKEGLLVFLGATVSSARCASSKKWPVFMRWRKAVKAIVSKMLRHLGPNPVTSDEAALSVD